MFEYFDYLYRYCLHDCKINKIIVEGGKLILIFENGIYELNSEAKQERLTNKCQMEIEFENNHSADMYSHIDINQIMHRKVRDVDFCVLQKMLENHYFDIDMNFYSQFCNTVLLVGYIKKARFEIKVSEISRINFVMDP